MYFGVRNSLERTMPGFIHKKTGFTLIEILVALVILTGSSIIISRIWSGNKQRVGKISDYHTISRLMEKKLTELEFEWRKTNFNSIPKEAKGDFKEEKYFSWSLKTQPLSLPDPQVLMTLLGHTQGMAVQVAQTVTQFLSTAVLEAKLTIHYKKGPLKSAYSLSTYIVDHNKDIQVSATK